MRLRDCTLEGELSFVCFEHLAHCDGIVGTLKLVLLLAFELSLHTDHATARVVRLLLHPWEPRPRFTFDSQRDPGGIDPGRLAISTFALSIACVA